MLQGNKGKSKEIEDGLYRLIGKMVIDSVPLTLTNSWKQGAQNNQHQCRVSFTDATKRRDVGFQVVDDGEEVLVIGEDGLKSLSGVDLGQLHMCIGHVMI